MDRGGAVTVFLRYEELIENVYIRLQTAGNLLCVSRASACVPDSPQPNPRYSLQHLVHNSHTHACVSVHASERQEEAPLAAANCINGHGGALAT